MKIEKTDKTNELKLEFEIEAKRFNESINKVYAKSAKYFNIPGFRKGKAPISLVEKTYGTQIFYEDAFNELVPEIYEKELNDNKLDVVSKPQIDIIQMEKGKNLIFTAIVQTKPEVKLGKYKGIEIKKIEYNVTEKDIKNELETMQERNSRIVVVNGRPVKDKDITIIDFEGFVEGKAFDGGKAENHELTIGSKQFIPGFEEQIIGMKTGEEKEIIVKFPEDYFSKDLAGKDATFKVKLHEIKEKELPKIDDEFAKDSSEFETLEELKKDIKTKLEEENKHKAKHETEDEAIKTITDNTEIDIPSGMIEIEIDNMIKEIEQRLSYQGMKFDQYLKFMKKTETELRKEYEPQAKNSVKVRLVLEAIQKDADIKVDEKDLEKELKGMAEKYGKKEEEAAENPQLKKYIEDNLKFEKTIDYIIDNAKIK